MLRYHKSEVASFTDKIIQNRFYKNAHFKSSRPQGLSDKFYCLTNRQVEKQWPFPNEICFQEKKFKDVYRGWEKRLLNKFEKLKKLWFCCSA